jgi:hypothetical protein
VAGEIPLNPLDIPFDLRDLIAVGIFDPIASVSHKYCITLRLQNNGLKALIAVNIHRFVPVHQVFTYWQ